MATHPLTARRTARAGVDRRLARRPRPGAWRRVPQRAVVEFTRCLAVMIHARLTLTQALETAAAQTRDERLRQVLERVLRDVQSGLSLSDGFAAHPAVFDRLFVHLARVGEAAGLLGDVLLRLAAHLEKSASLRRKVRAAMTYPALVLVVAFGATTFLLTAIVPTFAQMYADFGAQLPAPTRLILGASQIAGRHGAAVGLGLGVLAAALIAWRRSPGGRARWDRLVLALPLAGGLLRKSVVARFCRTLGTLLSSGVPLLDALDVLARTSGNRVVEAEVARILVRVRGGSSLNALLRDTRLFPPMVVQMIAVGEQTAELDRMLLHAAEFYEQEVDAAVDSLATLLEPVLIVVVGVLLGGILMAMYLPMFDLIGLAG